MSRLGCCLLLCVSLLCTALQSAIALAEVPPAGGRESIRTARELFDLFGIDDASFRRFAHGEPLDEAEHEQLARVLMRLPQIKRVDVERWTKRGVAWEDVVQTPADYQREFVHVEGRVQRVTRIEPAAEIKNRYALESYYRCEMTVGEEERPAVAFARVVPEKWPIDAPMNARASANAVFLKRGPESAAGPSELYLAVNRIAWHPDTQLGSLGMDYGLFDTVEQQRPITNQDRECFYQMLAAVGRAAAEELAADAADPASRLGPLTREPQTHVGQLHSFRGVARRAVKIQVSDPDTVARFGLDHYFELVVFVELNGLLEVAGQKVRSYPVVYCVRELPAGMPIGEDIAEVVQASGFMFKKWPYTTQMTEEKSPSLRMTSPLLIGKTVVWLRRDESQTLIGPLVGGVLVAAIAAIALIAWWFSRRERRAHEAVRGKHYALQAGESLNDLKLDAPE